MSAHSPIPIPASRILVLRLGAIGDCLRVLPALARLRAARPDAYIGWAVEHWVHPVLAGHPAVDRFHVLNRRELKGGFSRARAELARCARELGDAGYDVILDFHGRFKTGLLAKMSGVPVRVGYARGQESELNFLFTNRKVHLADAWENRVLRFLHLLEPLGISTEYDPRAHGVHVDAQALARATAWYESAGRPALACFPGTSLVRAHERWPEDKWKALLRALGEDGVDTVVFWGPAERELSERIASGGGARCRLAPDTKLPDMLAMIGRFRAFIGSDTAAMHMAWLQGVPTAVFMGPKPVRTATPLPPVPTRVLREEKYFVEGLKPSRQSDEIVTAVSMDTARRAVHELLKEAT